MVFYFSATGNSKYAAEKINAEFGGEIISITDAVHNQQYKYQPGNDEKVFFVIPVYCFTLPVNVGEFLDKLEFTGEAKAEVCAILTCESSAGGADMVFRKKMKDKNCEVKGVYKVDMPNNCVIYFDIGNRETQIMQLRKSEKTIEEIIDSVKFNYRVSYKSTWGMRLGTMAGEKFYRKFRKTKKFWVKETCTGCGLCQEICPEDVIKVVDGKPQWTKNKCVWCLGCINRCPAEAIQFGKKTEGRVRYFNPNLKQSGDK